MKALKDAGTLEYRKASVYPILERAYDQYFDAGQKKIFQKQRTERVLDRIDLALLLKAYSRVNNAVGIIKDYWVELKNGSMRKKRGFVSFEYSLGLVDEFQNYLPQQLELIKSCISKKSQSILYVGDMDQQVQFGTINNWDDIGEKIHDERKVFFAESV